MDNFYFKPPCTDTSFTTPAIQCSSPGTRPLSWSVEIYATAVAQQTLDHFGKITCTNNLNSTCFYIWPRDRDQWAALSMSLILLHCPWEVFEGSCDALEKSTGWLPCAIIAIPWHCSGKGSKRIFGEAILYQSSWLVSQWAGGQELVSKMLFSLENRDAISLRFGFVSEQLSVNVKLFVPTTCAERTLLAKYFWLI